MSLALNDRRLAILQHIRQAGQLTRREIAQRVGLSLSLVSRLTADLLVQGLITEVGRSESDGGRPPDLLALAPNAAYVVGLDIGGRRQRAIMADLRAGAVGEGIGGPAPFSKADRSRFLSALDDALVRLKRRL